MPIRIFFSATSLFALVACDVVGPAYTPPTIDLATTFVEGGTSPAENEATQMWWSALGDAKLNALIARGLTQNIDIQTAFERINAAQAGLGATGLDSQFSGSLSAQMLRSGRGGAGADTTSSGTANATFVFDLFGKTRRSQEQAQSNLDAAAYDAGTVQLAFLSSIVGNYIDARYYQEALAISRQTIESRTKTVALVQSQRDLGAGTDLSVAQAQAQLDTARAQLPSLEIGFQSSAFRIATLLAEPAGPLVADLQRGAPQPHARGSASVGIPANLLRNRPDILAAERRFAAAVAGAGVAEANLYPSVSLTGTVTVAATESWSFGPLISLPILGREALFARKEAAISEARQSELDWRKSVLSAIEEVQIAQSTVIRKQREVARLRDAATSNQRVLDLSRSAFQAGETSVLDLLDAERSAASARLSLAGTLREASAAWVNLQIAAGRGWVK